jgi:hypothetical protein
MLKIQKSEIDALERCNPGTAAVIDRYENAKLPNCSACGSDNVAQVGVGIVGMSIRLVSATTKFRLHGNGPVPGKFYCWKCEQYFGGPLG